MKPSRAFWGTFFVAIGTLLIIGRNYDIDLGFDRLWKFWPLVFVFIGLAVMVRNPKVKGALSAVAALGLAVFLFGVLNFEWLDWNGDVHLNIDDARAEGLQVQEFAEPYSANFKKASLSLDAAAGKFVIDTTTALLFKAKVESSVGRYELNTQSTNDDVQFHLKPEGDMRINNWRPGKTINSGEVKLNPNPVWDLQFDVGAAKVDCDLSMLKVRNVDIDAGAANVRIKLGMPVEETHLTLNAGASTMKISIPEAAGCEIRVDGGFSSKSFEDFNKVGEQRYQTSNFKTAVKKIYIDAEFGVSSIRVVRY